MLSAIRTHGEKAIAAVLLVAVLAISPLGAQSAVVIFGTVSGAPKAVTVDSSGYIGVVQAAGVVGTTSTYGAELAPSLIEANWTHGAGWENPIVGPGLIKNADGTGTQTPTAATNIVVGKRYHVSITLASVTVGSISYTLGSVASTVTMAAAGVFIEEIYATTTGKLIITPTNTSRLTITAISITESLPSVSLTNPFVATVAAPSNRTPPFYFSAYAWNSSGAAAELNEMNVELRAATVAGTTTSSLNFLSRVAAGAYTVVGTLTSGGAFQVPATGKFLWAGQTQLTTNNVDGVLLMRNAAGTDFTRLNFGGVTTAFPALTRNGNALSLTSGDGTLGAVLGHGAQTITLDGATTIAITSDHVILTCTGAETINTITGGVVGARLIIEDDDTDCTLTDDDSPTAANAIALTGSANIIGAVERTVELVFVSGGWWEEIATSDN